MKGGILMATALVLVKCDFRFSCKKSKKKVRDVGEWLLPGENNVLNKACYGCKHLSYLTKDGVIAFNPDLDKVVASAK